MKNKISTSLLVLSMIVGFAQITHAATLDCSITNCGSNGNPEMVTGGWGTTNSGVPHLSQGQVATDDNGIHSTCQWMNGCVDVYHTDWYKNLIQALRTQLGDSGFQTWINLQK